MPRRRRSQNPDGAEKIRNSAKRQKSENESQIKGTVDKISGSARARARSRSSLTEEEWTIGLPLPASLIPSGFLPSSQFQPQSVKELHGHERADAIRSWRLSEYKSRPPFARLLCLDKKHSEKLLAAYLGFNTVPQLHYFAYVQGMKLLSLFEAL